MSVYNYLLLLVPVVGMAGLIIALRVRKPAPTSRLHPGE